MVLHGRLEIISEIMHEIDSSRTRESLFASAKPCIMGKVMPPALRLRRIGKEIVAQIDDAVQGREIDSRVLG